MENNNKIKEGNNSKEVGVDNSSKEVGAINQSACQTTSKIKVDMEVSKVDMEVSKVDMEVSKVDMEASKVAPLIKALAQVLDIEQIFMILR
jgi:hypothetical protein